MDTKVHDRYIDQSFIDSREGILWDLNICLSNIININELGLDITPEFIKECTIKYISIYVYYDDDIYMKYKDSNVKIKVKDLYATFYNEKVYLNIEDIKISIDNEIL